MSYDELIFTVYSHACIKCKTCVMPDSYNPNYLVCDCEDIGQIDPSLPVDSDGDPQYPERWKPSEMRIYVQGEE